MEKPEAELDTEAERVTRVLEARGRAAIESRALGEVVVWVKHSEIRIPEPYADTTAYALDELEALIKRVDPEDLRTVHVSKTLFEGRVLSGRS